MSNVYSGYLAFGGKEYTAKRISVPNKSTSKKRSKPDQKVYWKIEAEVSCNFIKIRWRIQGY